MLLTTPKQGAEAAKEEKPIPEFVIEFISKNDKAADVNRNTKEYPTLATKCPGCFTPMRAAAKSTAPTPECSGDQVCSAEPVVMGFKMKAEEVFRLP